MAREATLRYLDGLTIGVRSRPFTGRALRASILQSMGNTRYGRCVRGRAANRQCKTRAGYRVIHSYKGGYYTEVLCTAHMLPLRHLTDKIRFTGLGGA